jgi:transcriptional regulator of acetoin/glycerol metabolism
MFAAQAVIERAREAFLDGSLDPDSQATVRPVILASWKRSLLHGLSPSGAIPRDVPGADVHGQLGRAVAPVLDRRRSTLADLRAGITVTDQEGRLLGRWVEDRGFARRLDARHVVAGASISEVLVGTNSSGMAVETATPTIVVGHEHFSSGAVSMTSVGAPVRHPVTRRLLGSLNLTCGVDDTHDLLLPWVRELAAEVEHVLVESASRRERLLLAAYATSAADARHPVVCLDDQTVISNAAAARMLDPSDQAAIWELAAHRTRNGHGGGGRDELTLTSGQVVRIEVSSVEDGASAFGALLRLTPVMSSGGTARSLAAGAPIREVAHTDELSRLAGRGPAWSTWCRQLRAAQAAADQAPLLLTGEAGTGKASAARALLAGEHDDVVELDATLDGADWVPALSAALEKEPAGMVLRRLDLLDEAAAAATTRIVGRSTGVRIVGTAMATAEGGVHGLPGSLVGWPGPVLTAPALRDRLEDLPPLLTALSKQITGRSPRWSPEVVQTLRRLSWPANLHSLAAAVRSTLSGHTCPDVGVHHLPSGVSARGARRTLAGLEQVEAHALTSALRAAGGNKSEAADALGIARSTLYRKVRALGLDLSASTF